MKSIGTNPSSAAVAAAPRRAAPVKIAGSCVKWPTTAMRIEQDVRHDEDEEDRDEDLHGLLDAAQVQDDEDDEHDDSRLRLAAAVAPGRAGC